MGLFRLIFLGIIVWLVYRFVQYLLGPSDKTHEADPGNSATRGTGAGTIDRVVRCAQCGLHVPEDEAVRDGNLYFCSAEHRDRHRRR